MWPYRKSDVTFQEIRSAGDLGLIRNPALRADIARHYSAGAGSQVVEVLGLIPRYREHVRGVTPWPVQKYIWSNELRFWMVNLSNGLMLMQDVQAQANALVDGIDAELAR